MVLGLCTSIARHPGVRLQWRPRISKTRYSIWNTSYTIRVSRTGCIPLDTTQNVQRSRPFCRCVLAHVCTVASGYRPNELHMQSRGKKGARTLMPCVRLCVSLCVHLPYCHAPVPSYPRLCSCDVSPNHPTPLCLVSSGRGYIRQMHSYLCSSSTTHPLSSTSQTNSTSTHHGQRTPCCHLPPSRARRRVHCLHRRRGRVQGMEGPASRRKEHRSRPFHRQL